MQTHSHKFIFLEFLQFIHKYLYFYKYLLTETVAMHALFYSPEVLYQKMKRSILISGIAEYQPRLTLL